MEPVNFPRPIRVVSPADRVKRMTPRDDRGHEGAFQRHSRRQAPEPAPPEEPEAASMPADGLETAPGAAQSAPDDSVPKQINIRV